MQESAAVEIELSETIHAATEAEWNQLARGDFVFADHRFLSCLEDSGSLGRRTGWYPRYLLARQGSRLVGALPLFAKTNSYGEYIFDWAWANAAEMAGDTYYPKLVSAIPFTPASGPKFIGCEDPSIVRALLNAARDLVGQTESRSLHFLFIPNSESRALAENGFLIRHSFQYHWLNEGWSTFDEFLGSLRSKRRSEIRRERAGTNAHGLTIETLTGHQITAETAQIMYRFYRAQTTRMGGAPYLLSRFFDLAVERLRDQMVFVLAKDGDEPVAGALNFYQGQTLFGRYWGALREYKHLHFELCYYRAIDWALANGISKFEAGAQGEHKFNRGFRPSLTLSAHHLENPDLARAVAGFLEDEKAGLADLFRDYREHDPFAGGRPLDTGEK